jgi:predicted CoA-binding protein
MKKTVVIGASPNEERYSYRAVNSLVKAGHDVVPIGRRGGNISGHEIITKLIHHNSVDTVTMYVGAQNQPGYYDYIIGLNPKRIIFNPGTENIELQEKARTNGIETIEACTLVMLSIGNY